jgi:hypothetical protein
MSARKDAEFFWRGQSHPVPPVGLGSEHIEAARFDAGEQRAVGADQCPQPGLAVAIDQLHELGALCVEFPGTVGFKLEQGRELRRQRAGQRAGRHAEALQVFLRKIDTASVEILGQIAQDVGELEGYAETLR